MNQGDAEVAAYQRAYPIAEPCAEVRAETAESRVMAVGVVEGMVIS
jgi:hypothetical protein